MTIAIFGNTMKPHLGEEIQHLLDFMDQRGVSVLLSSEIRQELNLRQYKQFPDTDETIDFALSVGGDGTFLTTAAMVGEYNIPILGINLGHLGFLSEVQTQDVDTILEDLVKGNYSIEQRSLLRITSSEGGNLASLDALNEIAVMKYGLSSAISIDCSVNGEHLTRYTADGLIMSTPTGSTAYNLSVGGPIMVPQARGIILTPIAIHSLTVRPLVIPDDWKIDLNIKSRTGSYLVSIDGRSQILSDTVTLHIEKSPRTVKLVQIGEQNFIKSLKEKLFFGSN